MKIKVEDLKEGDILRFDDEDIGVVCKTGFTCLHGHHYAKVKCVGYISSDDIDNYTIKLVDYFLGKKVGKIKYNEDDE